MILGQINKNKSLLRIITISIFVFIFLTPFIVFADATTTGILPPCVSSPTGCVFNDFLTLAQNIIDFVLKISVTVAVIMFTWAGILYLTASGDKGNIEKAHKIFTSVLIGFIIVISAWLIINTIANALLDKGNFKTFLE